MAPRTDRQLVLTGDALWTMAGAADADIRAAAPGDPTPRPAVAIDDGTIRWVGRADELPEGLRSWPTRHEAGTILPGFIDAHVHLSLPADGRDYAAMADDPDEMMALVGVRNLQRHLATGVTTIRDNGGRNRVTFIVRDAFRRGYFVGPQMLLAGRPLTPPHGHFHWCNGVADDEASLRQAVRQLASEGADHIKIMASGGGTAGTRSDQASYATRELRAAIDAAHELGLLTTAHCHARTSMVNVVDAGIDCMEHGYFRVPLAPGSHPEELLHDGRPTGVTVPPTAYDAQLVERMAEQGTFLSATLATGPFDELRALRRRQTEGRPMDAALEARAAGLEQRFARKIALFARARQDGLGDRMLISTDAGPRAVAFGRLFDGMSLGMQAGMSVADVVAAVTVIPARACGIDRSVGTIEPGKRADLLVVPGDPEEDPTILRRPSAVYLEGVDVLPELPAVARAVPEDTCPD